MGFLHKFSRLTSTGSYIPEIDGLRFLAILWVFVFHLNDYLAKNYHGGGTKIFQEILRNGHLGVELFFVISGFVLSLPFARHYCKQEKKVQLRQYFMRRLTRLEPPYFVIMILLFFFLSSGHLYTIKQLTPHIIASLFYVYNIVYPGVLPIINPVAWSLEIEIQFYIMVPLLARIFILKKNTRRILFIGMMILFPVLQYFYRSETLFFYQFMQYFIAGFLLADIYVNNDNEYFYRQANNTQKIVLTIAGIIVFAGILLIPSTRTDLIYSLYIPMAILLFYFIVLFIPFWKKIFSLKLVSTIGGMSYTIYLLHLSIISVFGRFFIKYGITNGYFVYFIIQFIIMAALTMIASSVFFYFIERPCMQKDWYKKLFKTGISRNPV